MKDVTFKIPDFLLLTPLNLPKGDTSGLHIEQLQHLTPLLGRGRGRSKE